MSQMTSMNILHFNIEYPENLYPFMIISVLETYSEELLFKLYYTRFTTTFHLYHFNSAFTHIYGIQNKSIFIIIFKMTNYRILNQSYDL